MSETALIVEIEGAEALVRGWRARHDPAAARGVPGHVTTLYPFVSPDSFDANVLESVAAVADETGAFDFDLVAVDEFPGVIWLRPHPDEPFRDLTSRLWSAFPEYPPYGGSIPDPRPHVTLGVTADARGQAELVERIRADLEPNLPIHCSATGVSVFMTDTDGVWGRAHRLDFRNPDGSRTTHAR